jgi:hypothetical protein
VNAFSQAADFFPLLIVIAHGLPTRGGFEENADYMAFEHFI